MWRAVMRVVVLRPSTASYSFELTRIDCTTDCPSHLAKASLTKRVLLTNDHNKRASGSYKAITNGRAAGQQSKAGGKPGHAGSSRRNRSEALDLDMAQGDARLGPKGGRSLRQRRCSNQHIFQVEDGCDDGINAAGDITSGEALGMRQVMATIARGVFPDEAAAYRVNKSMVIPEYDEESLWIFSVPNGSEILLTLRNEKFHRFTVTPERPERPDTVTYTDLHFYSFSDTFQTPPPPCPPRNRRPGGRRGLRTTRRICTIHRTR